MDGKVIEYARIPRTQFEVAIGAGPRDADRTAFPSAGSGKARCLEAAINKVLEEAGCRVEAYKMVAPALGNNRTERHKGAIEELRAIGRQEEAGKVPLDTVSQDLAAYPLPAAAMVARAAPPIAGVSGIPGQKLLTVAEGSGVKPELDAEV